MTTSTYEALSHLDQRNAVVESIVKDTATKHAAMDAVLDGAAGLSPIPGTSFVVLAGQLYAQTKTLYPHMLEKIAVVYGASPDAYTKRLARAATAEEGVLNGLMFLAENGVLEELGGAIRDELKAEFGQEFLMNLIQEALKESLPELALAQVPWIGAPAGAGAAGLLAWKLTWRVGVTASIYFQNGRAFVGGSRGATSSLVKKKLVSGKRPKNLDGTITELRETVPEIKKGMTSHVRAQAAEARRAGSSASQVRAMLERYHYPKDVVDAAMKP